MKTSNKFFFLIFFSFLILIPISSLSPYVSGAEGGTQVLGVDLLSVDTGNFVDYTSGDTIRNLKSSVGGRDLLAFENLGMISYNEETKTALYGGIITFGAEVNVYTGVLCEDAYPTSGGTDFNKITEQTFLSYQIWKHMTYLNIPCKSGGIAFGSKQVERRSFKINYREIKFGKLYSHNYDGVLPFKIDLDPGLFLSKVGTLEVAGQTFTVPLIVSNIKTVKEVEKRGGDVGSYEDRFTGENEGIDEVSVEIIVPSGTWSSDVQELTDWFNEEMVGTLEIGSIPLPKDCPTIQPSVKDLTLHEYPVGSRWGIQDYVEIPYKVHIQPKMYRIPQTIGLKYGHFHWWKCCECYKEAPFVVTNYYERNVGMQVSNVFVHTDFEIKVEVVMSCKFDVTLSESFLDDPNLVISDRIWGGALYGASNVKVNLPDEPPAWWEWIIWVIIILIIVYMGYKLTSKYLESKRR